MENKVKNGNSKVIICVTLGALLVFGLFYQQVQIRDLQFDLTHADAVVVSQNYKSEITWQALLCAEEYGISPDSVVAVWSKNEQNEMELSCSNNGRIELFVVSKELSNQ